MNVLLILSSIKWRDVIITYYLKLCRQKTIIKNDIYCLIQVLCTCDIKKAEWYIKRNIGVLVCEDPLTVRLKFEPSGRPEGKAGKHSIFYVLKACCMNKKI